MDGNVSTSPSKYIHTLMYSIGQTAIASIPPVVVVVVVVVVRSNFVEKK